MSKTLMIIPLLLTLPMPVFSDTETLLDSLLSCSEISDDKRRLVCFDALVPQKKPTYKNSTIDDFKVLLKSNSLNVGDSHEMFFQLLSATDGESVEVNRQAIEVYAFDFNSDAGKKAFDLWSNEGIVGHYPLKFKNLLIKVPGTHQQKRKIRIIISNSQ